MEEKNVCPFRTLTTMDVYMEATKDAKKKSFTDLEGKITLM